jgi:hypothetical protein
LHAVRRRRVGGREQGTTGESSEACTEGRKDVREKKRKKKKRINKAVIKSRTTRIASM